jgi:hypothetical protein
MTLIDRLARASQVAVILLVGVASSLHAQTTGDSNVLNSPADGSVAIRFFFQPPGDNFHVPLIFRVVDRKDPRYNTAPILDSGRTAYISLSDMQRLLPAVTHLPLLWRQAETVEVFGSFRILQLTDTMDIEIVSLHGAARAAVVPKKVCPTLSSLDSALKTSRALWEFRLFQTNYDCPISGFDYDAYPDRDANNH